MIAIDTNVLVRFLVKDHDIQYRASHKLFAAQDLFIPDTVVRECEWVLRHAYELDAKTIHEAFQKVFGLPNVYLSNSRRMAQVLDWYAAGIDFADALHLIASALRRSRLYAGSPHQGQPRGSSRAPVFRADENRLHP